MMNRFYNLLAIAAVILTPVAMMVALGWSTYSAILGETGQPRLAWAAGVATAAAVECIGIVAGETALWFHGRRDRRWIVAGAILAAYVAFGVVILSGSSLMLLPLMSGCVYVLIGLRAQAQREEAAAQSHAQRVADAQAARDAGETEWEREKWRIQQADRTRLKLVEVETKLAGETTETPKRNHVDPVSQGKRAEIHRALQERPGATYTEIAELTGVSRQYVGQVARSNGVHP